MSPDLPRPVREVIAFYEALTPDAVSRVNQLYSPMASFKDPFNEVQGHAAIRRIFEHMFATVQQPRFKVLSAVAQGQQAWLTWDFVIARGQGEWTIHGATQLHFDDAGRITRHRDYWDPAEELYAKVPVLGALVRWLTRRLSAG